jgi:hypothetical protein
MTTYDGAIVWLAVVLNGLVFAGLAARRRLGTCVAWTLYLAVVALSDALMASWPSRFWTRDFWVLKEGVLNLLKLAIGVELMVRIFGHFPTAYVTARRGVIVVVAVMVLMTAWSLSTGTDYVTAAWRLQSSINEGTVWLFVAVGAFCLWYHLPLDSIHKAILIGLVPYLLVYSVVIRALNAMGWERGDLFNATAPLAYLLMLAYWGRIAWRLAPEDDAGTRVARMVARRSA